MNAEAKELQTETTDAKDLQGSAGANGQENQKETLPKVEIEAVEAVLRAQGWDVDYVEEQGLLRVELEGHVLSYVINPSYLSVICTVPVLFDAGFETVLRKLANKINAEFIQSNACVAPAPNNADQYVIQHSCSIYIGAGLSQEQLEFYVTKQAAFSCYILEVIAKFLEQGKAATAPA